MTEKTNDETVQANANTTEARKDGAEATPPETKPSGKKKVAKATDLPTFEVKRTKREPVESGQNIYTADSKARWGEVFGDNDAVAAETRQGVRKAREAAFAAKK